MVHRRIKEGELQPHTNAIKPTLTEENKKARLEFCLSMIPPSLSTPFYDMFNVVHIDEKWFYMSKPSKLYYLVPGEDEPLRTCIFPFTKLEPAKRSSKNRVAGTLETKPILSVTKEVTRSWLIDKVLPAIRNKWPQGHSGPIFIQQDNAKPHISIDDEQFIQEASRDGFDIRLRFQPPNSPDLNVLDLGFFRAIQSLQ
uniref:uncharacterized protein LOC122587706 n=1 Tax=Erigeron canadensis TaxID=72917 RepID=UPI001CB8A40B|nr:uncharacterized protein LOC122587706 [Erigeron canadensis]